MSDAVTQTTIINITVGLKLWAELVKSGISVTTKDAAYRIVIVLDDEVKEQLDVETRVVENERLVEKS